MCLWCGVGGNVRSCVAKGDIDVLWKMFVVIDHKQNDVDLRIPKWSMCMTIDQPCDQNRELQGLFPAFYDIPVSIAP